MKIARLGVLAAVTVGLVTLVGLKVGDPPGTQMATFAETFLETLDQEQLPKAKLAYAVASRVDWHFIPKQERKGLMLREMNDAQRTAALRLLRASLSEAGYRKAQLIRELEKVLFSLEGDQRNWDRDSLMYYVTIFGSPSPTEAWGFSFEGHHLSLNFVCRDGKIVDSTPQFMASNPATILNETPAGLLQKGTRVLRGEEQLAFDLVQALNPGQTTDAVIADEALAEIRFAGEAQPIVGASEGIAYAKLNPSQQDMLRALINAYIEIVPQSVAKVRTDLIEKDGWEKVHFAWAGATQPGIGHYYRVQAPSFLIEFVNTQADAVGNPANHIHCVWRDLTGDFDLPPGV